MDRPKELFRPVKRRFIFFTLLIATLVTLCPLPWGIETWFPDVIGLLLLYWAINQPRQVNTATAFLMGLVADIVSDSLLGQHALAYTVTTSFVLLRQRQLVMFNLGQQSISVFFLLEINHFIMMLARMLTGSPFVGLGYFLPPFTSALLWPLLTKLLLFPYRRHAI